MISSLIAASVFGMLHRVGSLRCGWRFTDRPVRARGYHVAAAAAAAAAAVPSRLKMPPTTTANEHIKPTPDLEEYRDLEELASRVVNGSAARVSVMLCFHVSANLSSPLYTSLTSLVVTAPELNVRIAVLERKYPPTLAVYRSPRYQPW